MALHHKLAHIVGGGFNTPHAETHTVILPHATAYNAVAQEAMSRISRALGGSNAAQALFDLNGAIGAPRSLKELGMPESGIEQVVSLATKNPFYNPAPVTADGVRRLIRHAWEGRRPE
jgi:alcohol dehydrogenase class IV